MKNKKRIFSIGIITVIFLIAIMVFTTPTMVEFDKWILKENGIICDNIGWNEECTKDNQLIWSSSSHFKNVGIFASYEKSIEFQNGEQLTFRTLGIFGTLFPLRNGKIWEILN
ncbi:hypothetical protein [Cytobacillus oceanisediminis]|uniref:hypothetical protein n=1 Tax=Cytobacillus oceanisediminis TaxID=665099 RepID=UPI00207ADB1F|nr:hypothetical protein [Cytobacillus oceanisediminis]USK42250.1 hypothetical protein LIT27_16560 [Cytobacillus oceanisediminis]